VDEYHDLFWLAVGSPYGFDIPHMCVRHSSAGVYEKMMSEIMALVKNAGYVKNAVLTAAREQERAR